MQGVCECGCRENFHISLRIRVAGEFDNLPKHCLFCANCQSYKPKNGENKIMNMFEVIEENKDGITEVSAELFEYALCVLPPVSAQGCFGMGEISTHDSNNEPMYYFFGRNRDEETGKERYFAFHGIQAAAERIFAQIKGQAAWN